LQSWSTQNEKVCLFNHISCKMKEYLIFFKDHTKSQQIQHIATSYRHLLYSLNFHISCKMKQVYILLLFWNLLNSIFSYMQTFWNPVKFFIDNLNTIFTQIGQELYNNVIARCWRLTNYYIPSMHSITWPADSGFPLSSLYRRQKFSQTLISRPLRYLATSLLIHLQSSPSFISTSHTVYTISSVAELPFWTRGPFLF